MMRSFGSFWTLRSIGLEICGGSDGSRTRKNREAFWCILIQPYGQIRLCFAIATKSVRTIYALAGVLELRFSRNSAPMHFRLAATGAPCCWAQVAWLGRLSMNVAAIAMQIVCTVRTIPCNPMATVRPSAPDIMTRARPL